MPYRIFFAWQLDRHPNLCRRFIHRAAQDAVQSVFSDAELEDAPAIEATEQLDADEPLADAPAAAMELQALECNLPAEPTMEPSKLDVGTMKAEPLSGVPPPLAAAAEPVAELDLTSLVIDFDLDLSGLDVDAAAWDGLANDPALEALLKSERPGAAEEPDFALDLPDLPLSEEIVRSTLPATPAAKASEQPSAELFRESSSEDDGVRTNRELDRGAQGQGGAPSMAETILRKVREDCGIFLADVTPVCEMQTADGRKKQLPNANVMLELGAALAWVGWDRVILVMNTAFGDVELLPFDLRRRRSILYHLADSNDSERSQKRKELAKALAENISSIRQQGVVTRA